MSEFTKVYKKWHAKNNRKYDSAREYHKALMRKFGDWQPPKSPKSLVVVPQIVADFIKTLKIKGVKPLMDSATFGEIGFTEEKRDEILHWINEHQEEYMRAWLDDYTVEKEKLFYLRNKITRAYLFEDAHDEYFEYFNVKRKEMDRRRKAKFTQSEIDELHAGSYEQIEVNP